MRFFYTNLWLAVFTLCLNHPPLNAQTNSNSAGNIFPCADSLNYLHFEYAQNNVFVLSDLKKSNARNYLQVYNLSFKLITTCPLPGNYTLLKKAANGSLFVGHADTLFQIFAKGDTVSLAYPISDFDFEKLKQTYFFVGNNFHFFFTENDYAFNVDAKFKTENNQFTTKTIYSLSLEEENKKSNQNDLQETSISNKPLKGSKTEQLQHKNNIYKSPKSSPSKPRKKYKYYIDMAMIDSVFILTDLNTNQLLQYSAALSYNKTTPLEIPDFNHHIKVHGIDPITGNFYALLRSPKSATLYVFDKNTGEIIYTQSDFYQTQIEQIKVINNQLYYLQKNDVNTIGLKLIVLSL